MKHERLMGIAGTVIRTAPVLGLCLCTTAALAAYGLHWRQTTKHQHRALFSLVAKPLSRTVTAGGVARYVVNVRRGSYRGKIKLTLANVGPGLLSSRGKSVGNKATIRVRGQRAYVTVKTATADPAGAYKVKVKAVGGRRRRFLTMGLKIVQPLPVSFKISGNSGPLWPGTSQAVNLALTNPNSQAISVMSLVVAIKSVSAPRATTGLPCSAADFAVVPYSGRYPLNVPSHATVPLSDLGVVAPRGPQLRMLDRPVNQNGCQGATVTLSYSGTATSP